MKKTSETISEGTKRTMRPFFPTADQLFEADKHPKSQQIRDELGGVVFRPRNFRSAIRNGPPIPLLARSGKSSAPRQWFSVKNEASSDFAEIQLYDEIGEDWFGEGDSAKSFAEALNKIPKGRKILVRINSPGGNVYDGIAMYKRLRERAADVTTQIDGVALSIASVIALGGNKVIIAKTGQLMAHDPWTAMYAEGTADDIAEQARLVKDALDAAKKSITAAYVERTGKSEADVSALMSKTTWYVGQEAKDAGFVDEVSNEEAISNTFDISNLGRVPEAFRKLQNSAAQGGGQSNNTMDKATIIALLKEHGVEVDANSTIEQLQAKLKESLAKAKATPPPPAPPAAASAPDAATTNRIAALEAHLEAEKKSRIEREVQACVTDGKITVDQVENWVARCVKDESVLADLRALPANVQPAAVSVECVSESITDICSHVKKFGVGISAIVASGNNLADISNLAKVRSSFIRKNEARIVPIWNAGVNTVDAALKLDVLIDIGLRNFKKVMMSLAAFSVKFEGIPLQGNDKIDVPYYDLQTAASTQWVAANGYVAGDTTTSKRSVTIDQRYYQALSFTSQELRRQPFLNLAQLMELNAQKLAYDVWLAILGKITIANYATGGGQAGAATGWPTVKESFDSDKIGDLRLEAGKAQWPIPGRSLFINGDYDNQLTKDRSLKWEQNSGTTDTLREGEIKRIMGFDYIQNPNLPTNAENLVGFIAFKSALLIGFAPIMPADEVIAAGTRYQVAVDPDIGIPLEYRSFGDSQKDKGFGIVECNYGADKGNENALQRLISA